MSKAHTNTVAHYKKKKSSLVITHFGQGVDLKLKLIDNSKRVLQFPATASKPKQSNEIRQNWHSAKGSRAGVSVCVCTKSKIGCSGTSNSG